MPARPRKLFLGIGNVLQHDDGVGVRAAGVMAGLPLPPNVEVVDGGTAGLDLASLVEKRDLVVVVDAIDAGDQPGAIYKLTPAQLVPYLSTDLSLHDAHLLQGLDETSLRGVAPKQVVVLAVQVGDVLDGMGLSPPVEASLCRLVALGLGELGLPRTLLNHAHVGVSVWTCGSWENTPWN